jgi:hypothetical protein
MKSTTLISSLLAIGLALLTAHPVKAVTYTGYSIVGNTVSGNFGYPVDAVKVPCLDLLQYSCLEKPQDLRVLLKAFGNQYTQNDDVEYPSFPRVYFGDGLPILSFFSSQKQGIAIGISGNKFYSGYEPRYPNPDNVQEFVFYLPWYPDPLPPKTPDDRVPIGNLTPLGGLSFLEPADLQDSDVFSAAPEPTIMLGTAIAVVGGWMCRKLRTK